MHAIVILYNYYYRKQCPQLEFLSFETLCKAAVISNEPLVAYLDKTRSNKNKPSLVEEYIMQACHISVALSDHDLSKIVMWPIQTVAVFLADAKRENCFLKKDTLVKGVFSLVEKEVEGQKAEDVHEQIALSEVESVTGINWDSLRTWYSHCTYSLRKEKSRTMVFLVECSKPPADEKEFVEVSINYVLDSLKGPVITGGSKPKLTPVIDFFLLLPYADIISEGLSKLSSELDKEPEKRRGELAKTNNKSPMKIDNLQAQVEKEHSNGSLKASNGNDSTANKREHATTITINSFPTKSMLCFVGPSSNCSLESVKTAEESGNKKRENRTVKEITKDIKLEIDNANKELAIANSNPCTPTKRPIMETSIKLEILPFVERDFQSFLNYLTNRRDYMCQKHRVAEDEIAQCEMDLQTTRCEGQMTPKVDKIAERWEKPISSDGQLDSSVGCPNLNKKKKFRFQSSCQQLDDNCRENNLPLPRYCVHPSTSNGLFIATATLKSMDIDCMAESDLKMTPQQAREEAASRLMQKLSEMEED